MGRKRKQRPAWWNNPAYSERRRCAAKKAARRSAMKTYVIRAIGTERIKIGRSSNVQSRIKALQTGSPCELELALVVSGNIEAALHRAACDHRFGGEWFSVDAIDIVCRTALDSGLPVEIG